MIDSTRHRSVFSPDKFGDKARVDIIGCGATGSRIALSLAKLGIKNLHLWDFDIVEPHNLANQAYTLEDVGSPKVSALAAHIFAATGEWPTQHNEPVTAKTQLGNIVFLLTDTMKSRKEIWQGAIRFKLHIKLMVETRMGAEEGRIYSISPTKMDEIKLWESTLCEDSEAAVSECGTSISVGPTAEIISGMAVWQFIRWYNVEINKGQDELDKEIIFNLRPTLIMNRSAALV